MRTGIAQINARRRRGSTYVMILGLTAIITVIGISTLAVVRVNTRATCQANDWVEAQVLAFSAVEHALATINATSGWRSVLAGKTTEHSFARGTFQWRLADELDGDLTDDPGDPFVIITSGQVNDAVFKLKLMCFVSGQPLEALKTCLHADGGVRIKRGWGSRFLVADGAPVSTNGKLRVDKFCTLYGRGEARTVDSLGTITEGYSESADFSRPMPNPRVFAIYSSLIKPTNLGDPGETLYNTVLSPTTNSLGEQANANGTYFIDRGNKNLTLTNCNINGTLVVRCRKLTLRGLVRMRNYRPDFPALIVEGDVETKFNAPGEVHGLVHVIGSLTLSNTGRIRGAVICEGNVKCQGQNTIVHLPELHTNPPLGYTTGDGQIRPEAWTRLTD